MALFLPLSPNSVLKILLDIFSSATTSGLFFTTDLMVLIDITVRQISDLSLGDKVAMPKELHIHMVSAIIYSRDGLTIFVF